MNAIKEKISVLFVDDEEKNLVSYRTNFRREFTIFQALSATEALKILAENNVDVVVSDQRMPTMTGVELFDQIKELHPGVMRILVTGYADLHAVVDAINRGQVFSYMSKPFVPEELRIRIEQAHEVSRLRKDQQKMYRLYGQVFENSGDPILILTELGDVIDANPAAEKLLQMEKKDMMDGGCRDMVLDPEQRWVELKNKWTNDGPCSIEITIVRKNGDPIDCMVTVTHIGPGPDGQPLFQVMLMDITDRKQEENKILKLNRALESRVNFRTKQLQQAISDLESFSYTVAHDLRSPLKNIMAMSGIMGSNAMGPDEGRKLSDLINKGCGRMLELIDDLLQFARVNLDGFSVQNIDLNDLAKDAIEEQVPQDRKDRIKVTMDDLPTIRGDRATMKIVLNNLLSNSIKFTRNRKEALIHIGYREEGDDRIFWVQDNGVGFEKDKATEIFRAFQRLHRKEEFEGTGVGLAIVDRVVRKYNGQVWAESDPGIGTTIFMRLPKGYQPEAPAALPFAS